MRRGDPEGEVESEVEVEAEVDVSEFEVSEVEASW